MKMQTKSEKNGPGQVKGELPSIHICGYSFTVYLELVQSFHGYQAPGVILGGVMVDEAIKRIPENILFDAICETSYCLPDAVQLLTPCTTGNGWLKVINLGRYALSFYDKYKGNGVRVAVDPSALDGWAEIKTWLFKLKEKNDQDTPLLLEQIKQAGSHIFKFQNVNIQPGYLKKHYKTGIVVCPLCLEAYPQEHGRICRACRGETPYIPKTPADGQSDIDDSPSILKVPVEQAIGRKTLHDMTRIIPGESKGPVFKKGEIISAGDICRLHQMGRRNIYVREDGDRASGSKWIHEDKAALSFATSMAGEGVSFKEPPTEGKINFFANKNGLLVIDENRLEIFNMQSGVMCASRKNYSLLSKGRNFAGTRAIPLYLSEIEYKKAMAALSDGPLFQIKPLKKMRIGILVTGSEIFTGLVQDKFIPIIQAKVKTYGCPVVRTAIVPDDSEAICEGISNILGDGAELLITTAGLSVDPDDVTRRGLIKAGALDMLYGAPILPGAMTLLCRIKNARIFGIPACALYFKTTSFDLLLPRLLAEIPITRNDLAKLGHGAYCQECKTCKYPKCAFGK